METAQSIKSIQHDSNIQIFNIQILIFKYIYTILSITLAKYVLYMCVYMYKLTDYVIISLRI